MIKEHLNYYELYYENYYKQSKKVNFYEQENLIDYDKKLYISIFDLNIIDLKLQSNFIDLINKILKKNFILKFIVCVKYYFILTILYNFMFEIFFE